MGKMNRVSTTPDRLREAMQLANKKQIDLSKETGISHSTISRYLSGAVEPRQEAIIKLAVALDVSEWWLYGYEVSRDRAPEQKKNDQLAKLTVRMYRDPAFAEAISILSEMSPEELNSWLMLLRR